MLLRSSSSAFLLNGDPGIPLIHRRGLRQGDPLSPLLFILAIDILHRLIAKAADEGILAPLPGRELKLRTSLYADDAVIFANPVREELDKLFQIITSFGEASGLHLNISKCTITPIRCDHINLQEVLHAFGGQIVAFPIRYLGLPISLGRAKMVHFQFILNRIRARLAG